jgi:hypothetical protein
MGATRRGGAVQVASYKVASCKLIKRLVSALEPYKLQAIKLQVARAMKCLVSALEPYTLTRDILVSSLRFFERNLYRLRPGRRGRVRVRGGGEGERGGCTQGVHGAEGQLAVPPARALHLQHVQGGAVQPLTPPDPLLKGAWYQPLNLSSEKPVSSLCFQMQLVPLHQAQGGGARRVVGLSVQVESS